MSGPRRVSSLSAGLTGIEHMARGQEMHLPQQAPAARPLFLPETQQLDTILARPTLDERAARLVVPAEIGDDLLVPTALSAAREGVVSQLQSKHPHLTGEEREKASRAIALLSRETELDQDVREALAALLRG